MNALLPWRTAWRIARRDLSARFRGLRLLLVCLFLGTGALAAIGTLTGSIERELAARGSAILGGDIEAEVWQRGATPEEMRAFAALGQVSTGTRLQAMAQRRRQRRAGRAQGGRCRLAAGWHADAQGRTQRPRAAAGRGLAGRRRGGAA